MPGQSARQHGPQLVQRVGDQRAGKVHAAMVIGRVGASSVLAGVFQIGGGDYPGQPSSTRCGVILKGLGFSRGHAVPSARSVTTAMQE